MKQLMGDDMPKYWVQYATDAENENSVLVEAKNKREAEKLVSEKPECEEVLEVTEE